jgi:cyclopropane fatty-acyl-phospholipid synthase-like methyltransferase
LELQLPKDKMVYVELGLEALLKVIDTTGVEPGDHFLDIGAGDGLLVNSAATLWSEYLQATVGIKILPSLFK